MALNTEIDALLAEASNQGLTIEQVIQQVALRNRNTLPDEYPGMTFSNWITNPSSDWPILHAYLEDISTTMPLDIAWSRAWSAEVSEDADTFLRYMLQIIRILGRDNQYNLAFPSFGYKSKVISGQSEFNFT